jgi:hypothetical protein
MDSTWSQKAIPPYPVSDLIRGVELGKWRYHHGVGDMWPITWATDDNMYTGAGDNRGSAMNFWRVRGAPNPEGRAGKNPVSFEAMHDEVILDVIDNEPLDPAVYCTDERVHTEKGLKPAGLLDLDGTLMMAVQTQNYGSDPVFSRQTNIHGWIITTKDFGQTWDREATPQTEFFSGRVASCHFVQYGRGADNVRDGYVYAYFPGASDDGNSYWENGDYVLLGRVSADAVLDRSAWEFWTGLDSTGQPQWSPDDDDARPIFEYFHMTGENHVSYNAGLDRYIMGNYGFVTDDLYPRPYHQGDWPETTQRSQLTLFEAPNLWGPWSMFHRDDDWGMYGGYQPAFPVKWMFNEGRTMFMVSSGTGDDYNFTMQRLDLDIAP